MYCATALQRFLNHYFYECMPFATIAVGKRDKYISYIYIQQIIYCVVMFLKSSKINEHQEEYDLAIDLKFLN